MVRTNMSGDHKGFGLAINKSKAAKLILKILKRRELYTQILQQE